ncbi:11243_t:CDS:2, partial [Cetraspora pellucida]
IISRCDATQGRIRGFRFRILYGPEPSREEHKGGLVLVVTETSSVRTI